MLSDLDKRYHHLTGTVQAQTSFVKWIKAKELDSMMPSVMLQDDCGQVNT